MGTDSKVCNIWFKTGVKGNKKDVGDIVKMTCFVKKTASDEFAKPTIGKCSDDKLLRKEPTMKSIEKPKNKEECSRACLDDDKCTHVEIDEITFGDSVTLKCFIWKKDDLIAVDKTPKNDIIKSTC